MPKYRQEIKYLINAIDYKVIKRRLDSFLKKDKHVLGDSYFVRSLYFDSIDNKDYFEKMAGIHTRKKIRMRIYDLNDNKVYFQIKNKENNLIFKETVLIKGEDASKVIAGEHDILLKYKEREASKIYRMFKTERYRPVVLIDYYRMAYEFSIADNDIRITFDRDIKKSETDFNLYGKNVNMKPVIDKNLYVFEVKYNSPLPEWIKRAMITKRTERIAISKYTFSRSI